MDYERNFTESGACEIDTSCKEEIEGKKVRTIIECINNEEQYAMPLPKSKTEYLSLLSDQDFQELLARKELEECSDSKIFCPYNNLTCTSALLLARKLKSITKFNSNEEQIECKYYTDNRCDDANINMNTDSNCIEKNMEFTKQNNNNSTEENILTDIDISYNSIHIQGAIALFKALRNNTSLRYLNLSGNVLTEPSESGKDVQIQNRAESQKNENNLDNVNVLEGKLEKGLDMHHCFNEILKEMLWHNNTLTHLYLNNTSLGITELISLFYGLKSNVALRVLHLARPTYMSAECMKYVISHLNNALIERTEYITKTKLATDCGDSEPSGLVELNLSFFGIENDHLQSLLPGLQLTPSLETLLLRGNRLSGESGGRVLCELLKSHTVALKCLDVGANALKGTGAICLADGVKAHSSLQIIRFDCNKITQEGMMTLVTALGSCANIREVNLWGNEALTEQCVINTLGTTCDAMHWDGNVQLDFGLSNNGSNDYTIFKV